MKLRITSLGPDVSFISLFFFHTAEHVIEERLAQENSGIMSHFVGVKNNEPN